MNERSGTVSWDAEDDVVIVGFGDAACAAAIEARAAGAEVTVLEKTSEAKSGGNSRVSGQIWFKNDDVERSKVYLRSLSGDRPVPDAIVEVWAEETSRNTDWLVRLGAEFELMDYHRDPEFPELDGSDCYGGYLHIRPTWGHSRLYEFLSDKVAASGAEVLFETPGRELVTDDRSGEIVGVKAERDGKPFRIRARRGVVLATGGFENDAEMIRDYLRLPARGAPWGSPFNTGDGHRMAQKVGASMWHMDNFAPSLGLRVPGSSAGFPIAFYHASGYIFIGFDGRRFANETLRTGHGHGLVAGQYEIFPQKPMYVVFDEQTRRAGPLCPPIERWPYGWTQIVDRYDWSEDNSVEVEKGWFKRGETLDELASKIDVAPDALRATVDEWNAACGAGSDFYGRDPATLTPIDTPPFFAFEAGPNILYTCGGPRRNEHAQVLDAFGAVIPRLYCAGEVSSTYSRCMDGGMMIGDALAFGRVAGRGVAAERPL